MTFEDIWLRRALRGSPPTGLVFGIYHFFYKYLRGAAAYDSCRAAKY